MADFWATVGRAVVDDTYFGTIRTKASESYQALADWLGTSESDGGGPLRLSRADVGDLQYIFTQTITAESALIYSAVSRPLSDITPAGFPNFSRTDPALAMESIEFCAVLGLATLDTTYHDELLKALEDKKLDEFLLQPPAFFPGPKGEYVLRHLNSGELIKWKKGCVDFEEEAWRKPEGEAKKKGTGRCSRGQRVNEKDAEGKLTLLKYLHLSQPELDSLLVKFPHVAVALLEDNKPTNPGLLLVP